MKKRKKDKKLKKNVRRTKSSGARGVCFFYSGRKGTQKKKKQNSLNFPPHPLFFHFGK